MSATASRFFIANTDRAASTARVNKVLRKNNFCALIWYLGPSAVLRADGPKLPLFFLMAISSHPFFSFMLRHLGSFSFSSARHFIVTSNFQLL